MTFEQPKVNVPIQDVTVTATDKNVYLKGEVTADQLKDVSEISVGDVKLDLSKATDTDKPYGLDPWQTEYVDITVTGKDKDGNDEKYCMGDCAINIDYQDTVDKATGEVTFTAAQKLAEVAVESARTAEFFGIDPKVALLSFSTKGSGKGGTVQLSHDATIEAQKLAPELAIDGEMQFDAAVSPVVGQLKFPGSKVAGYANTFIFPCIEAGNIGYKIAQRLGGFEAYGPILQGLNAPINDLSRGCNADEVYKMAIITAGMA